MRISDWSSDVCSSDLLSERISGYALYIDPPLGRVGIGEAGARKRGHPYLVGKRSMERVGRAVEKDETQGFMKIVLDAGSKAILGAATRSEEPTSELQSLMRNSYAVSCLTKQTQCYVTTHNT